jgi:hypothetical protein
MKRESESNRGRGSSNLDSSSSEEEKLATEDREPCRAVFLSPLMLIEKLLLLRFLPSFIDTGIFVIFSGIDAADMDVVSSWREAKDNDLFMVIQGGSFYR